MSFFFARGKSFNSSLPGEPADPFAPKEEYHKAREREDLGRRWDTGLVRYQPLGDDDFFISGYETGWTRICYVDRDGVMTVRDISLKEYGSDDFEAYCSLRDGIRLFKVAQIEWIQECEVPSNLPADWKTRTRLCNTWPTST
jgi:hypothetical protein